MDETLLKRLVGVVALILAAMLLTSILPKPGPAGLDGGSERVVTMDLTQADSAPVEIQPPDAAAPASTLGMETEIPPPTAEASTHSEPIPTPPVPESAEPPAAAIDAAPSPGPAIEPATPAVPASKASESPPAPPQLTSPTQIAKPVAAPSSANGKWQVQAGAYSQLDRAESVRSKAAAVQVPCVISPADTGSGTFYRVRCGPYATRELGAAAVELLDKSGIKAQVVGASR